MAETQEVGRQESGDGRLAFLRQAYRNNWERYLASLGGEGARGTTRGAWDRVVLTASDARQAAMYRRQLDLRRAGGLLPAGTRFEVLGDPPERRIGSGGATLRVIAGLGGVASDRVAEQAEAACTLGSVGDERPRRGSAFPSERVLVIHSGGDSRRLPHCSAAGKLFARVPRVLPDGRASTLFDEFLVSLSGVARTLPSGVLVASGDVLLLFDHLQLDLHRPGASGVAIAAPAETGTQHGVYVVEGGGRRSLQLRAFLHKPSLERLRSWGAIADDGMVPVDTGLVWFDAPTAGLLVDLAGQEALTPFCTDGGPPLEAGLNLYGDLLMPLVPSTTHEAYMADTSDGPLTAQLQAARTAIWERLRGVRFAVQRLQPAVFAHFGTTREYWAMVTAAPDWARAVGWTADAASWACPAACTAGGEAVLLNAAVEGEITLEGHREAEDASASSAGTSGQALVVDSWLRGTLAVGGAALVTGVRAGRPIALRAGLVLHRLPIEGDGYVTRLYGLDDDPKQPWDGPAGSYLNRPWATWLAEMEVQPEVVWPGLAAEERALWNARLYPLAADGEESIALSLPLQCPAEAAPGWREWWLASERLSLAESYRRADGERLLAEVQAVEDTVAAGCFCDAVAEEQPAAEVASLLGTRAGVAARRAGRVAERMAAADAIAQLRGYEALAVATRDGRWEEKAFAVLREMIEGAAVGGLPPSPPEGGRVKNGPSPASSREGELERSPPPCRPVGRRAGNGPPPASSRGGEIEPWRSSSSPPRGELKGGSCLRVAPHAPSGGERPERVRVSAAARIDFGGGWTDTPPYSIERGGAVLNAAITLHGEHPIVAQAERLAEPWLVLESGDIEATIAPTRAGEVLDYANPADPFALLKAAVVLCGLVPPDAAPQQALAEILGEGGGVRLHTQTSIPRGSGLGTSSILAGAVLACLGRLLDCAPTQAELFDQVLCLEQMMTTGGGWQDQVGGLTGGIKLVTSTPGLPQRVHVVPVVLSPETGAALRARLRLVYTGQQRLAKNLLQAVMGRWMARDPEMVWIQGEIARLAVAMRDALVSGDVDTFGELLSEHWALNKRMDAGCTNEFIDGLFADMGPFVCGGKLAGAGGGGFAIVVARDEDAATALERRLRERYGAAGAAIWPCTIPEEGILISTGLAGA
jgi:galactokinase/mevalonate kinase-like predicted kinase